MLEDELDRIVRRYGKVESQETVTGKDDILYATYEVSDAEGNVAAESQKVEDTVLVDKLPAKLKEMVMGKQAGATVVFRPADVCTEEELAAFLKDPLKQGQEAAEWNYKLTITKVGLLIPRELDAELFAQVFPNDEVKDEADFKERIRKELSKEFDRLSRERLDNEIFELLVHNTKIELPVAFLRRWLKEGGEKRKTDAEVDNEFGSFEHQLRWTLISDKLIQDYDVAVSREDVNADIKNRVLAYFGMQNDEDAPWLDSYMAKVAKDEKTIDETYRRLLYEKLFQVLETKFNVTDKEISEEEFFKLQSAHTAHHHH